MERCEIQGLLSLTDHLLQSVQSGNSCYQQASIQENIANLIARTMIYAQGHNRWDDILAAREAIIHPGSLKRAEAYVRANLEGRLAPADIAEAVGVSVRSLYRLFRDYHGVTPMEYVRTRKLKAIRKALLDPAKLVYVSDAARNYGFEHMGHFCSSYRKLFGELPHITLRQSRQ